MSEQKITTQEPKHSDELLQAVERTLASHNLRLKPGQSLADVADAFEANQVKLSVAHELIKQY